MNNVMTQAMANALGDLWEAAAAWASIPANDRDSSPEAARLRVALDVLRVQSTRETAAAQRSA